MEKAAILVFGRLRRAALVIEHTPVLGQSNFNLRWWICQKIQVVSSQNDACSVALFVSKLYDAFKNYADIEAQLSLENSFTDIEPKNIFIIRDGKQLFYGDEGRQVSDWTKSDFEEKKAMLNYRGQKVSFIYNGGSHPGSVREVFVLSQDDDFIYGYDCDLLSIGEDVEDSYRKFAFSKITDGDIEVLG